MVYDFFSSCDDIEVRTHVPTSEGFEVASSVCVVIPHLFWTTRLFVDVPAGVTQEEDQTGFLHLASAVLALIFLASRIQSFLSLAYREVEFCVLTI